VFDQFAVPGALVLDVGSWIGPTALYAASCGSDVHAFEPDPIAYLRLQKNLALNQELGRKVVTSPIALASSSGKMKFFAPSKFGSSCSSLLAANFDQCIEVEARDAKEIFQSLDLRRVCLIKMDIEGGEYSLIPHVSSLLSKYKPTLYLSLHPENYKKSVPKVFSGLAGAWASSQMLYFLRSYRNIFTWDEQGQKLRKLDSLKWKIKKSFCYASLLGGSLVFSDSEI